MLVGTGVDQLGRDAQPVAGFAHGALEDVRDVQLAGNLRQLNVLALVRKRGAAGGHLQRRDLGEEVQQLFGQAVGEIFLILRLAHVHEGQHRDGFGVGGVCQGGGRLQNFRRHRRGHGRGRFGFGGRPDKHEGNQRQHGYAECHGHDGETGFRGRGGGGLGRPRDRFGSGLGRTRRLQQSLHLLDKLGRGLAAGQARAVGLEELLGDIGVGFPGVVDDHRDDEGAIFRHVVGAVHRHSPLAPKVAFLPRLRVGGDDRHEKRAVLDLAADFLVPHIAAAQFAHVEPDLHAKGAEGFGNVPGGFTVFPGIGKEDSAAGAWLVRHDLALSHAGLPGTLPVKTKGRVPRVGQGPRRRPPRWRHRQASAWRAFHLPSKGRRESRKAGSSP